MFRGARTGQPVFAFAALVGSEACRGRTRISAHTATRITAHPKVRAVMNAVGCVRSSLMQSVQVREARRMTSVIRSGHIDVAAKYREHK